MKENKHRTAEQIQTKLDKIGEVGVEDENHTLRICFGRKEL